MANLKNVIRLCVKYQSKRHFAVKIHAERAQLALEKKPRISDEMMKKHAKESRYLLDRCNNITQVCEIIDGSPIKDTVLYTTALHVLFLSLNKGYTFDDVYILLNKMEQDEIPKTLLTYHEILKIYSRSGNFDKCMNFFNDMVDKERIRPNVVTFNRLMKCCRYSNDIDAANEVLRMMQNDFNICPDMYTWIELMYLYRQLNAKDLSLDVLNKIIKELKGGKGSYDYVDIIDAMNANNVQIEYIETVFECMLQQNIIPDEVVLNKMLYIVINREDTFRIVSYFDMLVELMTNSKKMKPLSITINALEIMIAKQNDFISAHYFIDDCIRYGIKISNKKILTLYWECIKCAYLDLADTYNKDDDEEKLYKMIEIAKDLPAQLAHLQIMQKINRHRLIASNVIELYSDILMSFLRIKAMDKEDETMNGGVLAYDLLSYWYDSYYITKDLWNDYVLNEDGEYVMATAIGTNTNDDRSKVISMFNVSEWTYYELKTLLVFLILERFGNILLNEGRTYLNIKLCSNGDENAFIALKTKLQSSYGTDLVLEAMEGTQHNIVRIDLNSWHKCVEPEVSSSESDEDDPIDRELYLE